MAPTANGTASVNGLSRLLEDLFNRALPVARALVAGRVADPTGGALNFVPLSHFKNSSNYRNQALSGRLIPVAVIGSHIFFCDPGIRR